MSGLNPSRPLNEDSEELSICNGKDSSPFVFLNGDHTRDAAKLTTAVITKTFCNLLVSFGVLVCLRVGRGAPFSTCDELVFQECWAETRHLADPMTCSAGSY